MNSSHEWINDALASGSLRTVVEGAATNPEGWNVVAVNLTGEDAKWASQFPNVTLVPGSMEAAEVVLRDLADTVDRRHSDIPEGVDYLDSGSPDRVAVLVVVDRYDSLKDEEDQDGDALESVVESIERIARDGSRVGVRLVVTTSLPSQ